MLIAIFFRIFQPAVIIIIIIIVFVVVVVVVVAPLMRIIK